MKYEFASRPWFAALHAVICEKARIVAVAQPDFSYSLCEVFTGIPPALVTISGGRTAWHAIIRGADVTFELAESNEADFKAIADYASVLPIAHYDTMGRAERAAELQAMSVALVTAGKLQIIGSSPAASGGPLSSLHNSMARLTK